MSAKELSLAAIARLPEDADFRDISEEIAFLAGVRVAERDIEEGRVISDGEMRARIDSWRQS